MSMYKVYDYGVCGNNKDGYEINDIYALLVGTDLFHCQNVYIRIDDKEENYTTIKQSIIKQLKLHRAIGKKVHFKSISIEGEYGYTLYLRYNTSKVYDYPLFELRKLNDDEIANILEK